MDDSVAQEGVVLPPTEEVAEERGRPFGAMYYRNYQFYWWHNVILNIGENVGRVATRWLVYDMTGSQFLLGAVVSTLSLPMLFLSLIAGVAADKIDRRLLMLAYIAVGTVNFLIFALLLHLGLSQVWSIFLFSLISGIVSGAYFPTRRAILPMLVRRGDLINAVALGNLTPQLGATIGGAVGGWILATWAVGGAFLIGGIGWGLSFFLMFLVTVPAVAAIGAKTNAWADILEGLKYVKADPVMMGLMLFALVPSMFGRFYEALLPVFAKDILHEGAEGMGWLTALASLGAVATSLVVSSMGSFQRKGLALVLAALSVGVTSVLFAFSRWYVPSLILVFAIGATSGLNSTLSLSLLQLYVPDRLRGRVTGIWVLTMPGTIPLPPIIAGLLADRIGAPWSVASAGIVLILLIAIMGVMLPKMRQLN